MKHRRLLLALSFFTLLGACRCGKKVEAPTSTTVALPELQPKRIPDSDLVLSLPKGWLVELPRAAAVPDEPKTYPTKIELKTRKLLEARPGTPAANTLVPPILLVLHDPWLPVGTSAVDYLQAQRQSNQAVIGTAIRHVDAEPSRRGGRPTYHIRDEWTVTGKDGAVTEVSQEALLLVEAQKAGLDGYTVVITLEKKEFETFQPVVRAILDSVRFEPRNTAE